MAGALNVRARGFSLIELMITLAVAAVLIGVGIPAFNGFVDQQRLTTYTNDLISSLAYARSEAVKLGGVVSVVADAPVATNEWGGGFCVAVGSPNNCAGTVLRRVDTATNATLDAIGNLNDVTALRFNGRGALVGLVGGDVQVCATDTSVVNGRTISISPIGRTAAEALTCH